MTKTQREEVKEMLHEVLQTYQVRNEAQHDMTNISLERIDKHLEKINGKVAEHEKVINIHLPHNTTHCPQKETIEHLRDNMISAKAIRRSIYAGIASAAALMSIFFIIYKVFIEKI